MFCLVGVVVGMKMVEDIFVLIVVDFLCLYLFCVLCEVGLEGVWIGVGFVCNVVWDYLYGYGEVMLLVDIDVFYFVLWVFDL